jgi:hypothetical protein
MRLRRGRDAERAPAAVYLGLRQQVLRLTPEQLGDELVDGPILALLMETGYPEAVATLVAVVDGTTSLYFSNGGGVLGAAEHDAVAEASRRWLETGREFLPDLSELDDASRLTPRRADDAIRCRHFRWAARSRRTRGGPGGRATRAVTVVLRGARRNRPDPAGRGRLGQLGRATSPVRATTQSSRTSARRPYSRAARGSPWPGPGRLTRSPRATRGWRRPPRDFAHTRARTRRAEARRRRT